MNQVVRRCCNGIHSQLGSTEKRCSFSATSIAPGSVVIGNVMSSVVILERLLLHMGQTHLIVLSI